MEVSENTCLSFYSCRSLVCSVGISRLSVAIPSSLIAAISNAEEDIALYSLTSVLMIGLSYSISRSRSCIKSCWKAVSAWDRGAGTFFCLLAVLASDCTSFESPVARTSLYRATSSTSRSSPRVWRAIAELMIRAVYKASLTTIFIIR